MGKNKKKRTKTYTGVDAAIAKPVVTKISAADRSKLKQWWFDKKRVLKPVIIVSLIVAVVVWLLIEFFRVVNN